MHHVVAEEGYLVPGIIAVATDSHALTGGALGAMVLGVGGHRRGDGHGHRGALAEGPRHSQGGNPGEPSQGDHVAGHHALPHGAKGLGWHKGGMGLPGH